MKQSFTTKHRQVVKCSYGLLGLDVDKKETVVRQIRSIFGTEYGKKVWQISGQVDVVGWWSGVRRQQQNSNPESQTTVFTDLSWHGGGEGGANWL